MQKNITAVAIIVLAIVLVLMVGSYYRSRLSLENPSGNVSAAPEGIDLPEGFTMSVFAENLTAPRVLAFDPNGVLVASITSTGEIVALPSDNPDNPVAEKTVILASGLNRPHGLAFYCKDSCKLYVAETDNVSVFDYDADNLKLSNKKKIIDLPEGGQHFTRTLLILASDDGDRLLVALGSDCNVCVESDWRRASILSADMDGKDLKTFASGLRNSVFMALEPQSGKVFATENGRDLLGDDIPPDEINIIEEGKNYGWPICYGNNIHDGDFDKNVYIADPCRDKTASHIDIQAHSAPLGLAFVPDNWPSEYRNDLFVSLHGSWNRSVPTGYKVTRFSLDAGGLYSGSGPEQVDFITGWLDSDGKISGRPTGIAFDSYGNMFVADDRAGAIYKIVPPVLGS
ncbi:MAG TPA: PQQ-dependent sugar dehydrogenase [Candidatus Colwellbacteria bacterium]|nr:PQQ-dependent sugar dehydrogenase [Candidatus Colwellbacteria bacterium]HQA95754.1 PQQ-dependent sugar dehydrogenase [Candidatus Colwellbacteria bacterium]